ncbi:MAG: SpoIIE family protein phosphatase [Planctomycetaceae bacterium]|nr:SpoIIE family protein phosphatase [Planctomycetales bacterium]MCB9927620.1 SpoIIE family protein phosphatase [Planctomycetaceae bacterium]
MASLIVVEQGKKTLFDLQPGVNLIGRHPDCQIEIVQASVSGKHAAIHGENGVFYIEDTGSRNGTFVNKQQVTSRVRLNHNDMVQFGDAVSKFEQPEAAAAPKPVVAPAPAPTPAPAPSKSSAATVSDISGTVDGAMFGTIALDDDTEEDTNITGQMANQGRFGILDTNPEAKLKAVLEISQALAGEVNLDVLLPKILDSLFSIFTYADRGCILLKNEKGEMVPKAMKHRREGEDATVRLSRTIINKVLTDKCGVMSADASMDDAFSGSQSIADLKIRSMMCVPLLGLDGEPLGVLSIDSQNPLGQFGQDDLEILMTVAGQAALSYENARLMQSYAQKMKQDGELVIAQTVQRALLPTAFPKVEGYEFYASYDSAQAVGGDYFDVFPLPDGKVVLSFGDVAGKGVPGALIMSRMSSCVQSTIRHVTDLEEAICAINDHMCDSAVEGRFVTYVLAIVDPATHTFKLSNAGHMSPIIRRASGEVEQFDEELVGPPIGVVDGYPFDTETKSLEPGDLVVLFTDGVDEAMNFQDEFYGGDRLLEFVKNGPAKADELGKALLADVRKHANGRPQNDDITIMTFGRNPE